MAFADFSLQNVRTDGVFVFQLDESHWALNHIDAMHYASQ